MDMGKFKLKMLFCLGSDYARIGTRRYALRRRRSAPQIEKYIPRLAMQNHLK